MTIEAIKTAIVRAVDSSKFQVDFIDNNQDGSLIIKVSRPMKYNHQWSVQCLIRDEDDIGKFEEVLTEQIN
jgi:hypothetical protein